MINEAERRRKKEWRKHLRDLVTDADESRQEIADVMGVHVSTLADYLNGPADLPADRVAGLVAGAESRGQQIAELVVGAARNSLSVLADVGGGPEDTRGLGARAIDLTVDAGALCAAIRDAESPTGDGGSVITVSELERILEHALCVCRTSRGIGREASRRQGVTEP